jgi:hypothetical protein
MRLRSMIVLVALVFLAGWIPADASTRASSRATAPGVITVSNASQLQLAWIANTGSYTSPPSVVDGVVYVGTKNGPLYAFSATCGTGGSTCQPLCRR